MNESLELTLALAQSLPRHADERVDWVQPLRDRDPVAWTAVFEEHRDFVFRSALSQVGDRELAEDITGQVFLEAIQGIHRFRDRGTPFSAWLLTIARHRSLDALRKRRRDERTPLLFESHEAAADSSVLEALSLLTPEQREVIHLRFVEDLPIEQVARMTGRNAGAVKSLQHRALRRLRTQLDSHSLGGRTHA
jgi:RNA polymerase sigma-70 factor (ECF subfamily)